MRILIFCAFLLTGCGFEIVDTGYRGIKTEFGKITGDPLNEGLHFYNPFIFDIIEINVREKKYEEETLCFTRDTQRVLISFALIYFPDPTKVHDIFQSYGREWDDKIIIPTALGVIKDTIGKYIADDLVGKREEAKNQALNEIRKQFALKSIIATDLSFTSLSFDKAYEKAVEDKVVAIQRAAEAKNRTVQVEESAKQTVIEATAEAQSMTIRSEALARNKGLVDYEAVQKWDGKLPQYVMGNSMPFINLSPK